MTAEAAMRARRTPVRLVILDCDGVIVDSEPVSNRVIAENLSAHGWKMTAERAEHLFIGTSIDGIEAHAEAAIGAPMPAGWRTQIKAAIIDALSREAAPIPGAIEAMRALTASGMPWRIASNSSHDEMQAKFARLGIAAMVVGRVHSYEDVGRGKPEPDLFLAAAAAEGTVPAGCLVVEDSVPGVRAARAAGMQCLGLDRSADGAFLQAAGAVPFHDMTALPGLVALARRVAA